MKLFKLNDDAKDLVRSLYHSDMAEKLCNEQKTQEQWVDYGIALDYLECTKDRRRLTIIKGGYDQIQQMLPFDKFSEIDRQLMESALNREMISIDLVVNHVTNFLYEYSEHDISHFEDKYDFKIKFIQFLELIKNKF